MKRIFEDDLVTDIGDSKKVFDSQIFQMFVTTMNSMIEVFSYYYLNR